MLQLEAKGEETLCWLSVDMAKPRRAEAGAPRGHREAIDLGGVAESSEREARQLLLETDMACGDAGKRFRPGLQTLATGAGERAEISGLGCPARLVHDDD